jgi:hypothetical protein
VGSTKFKKLYLPNNKYDKLMILNKIYGNKFRRTKRNRNKKSVLTLNLTLQHKNSITTKHTYKYRKHKASNDAYILKHKVIYTWSTRVNREIRKTKNKH